LNIVRVTDDGSSRFFSFVGTMYQSTRCHTPEGRNVYINCCELLHSLINLPGHTYMCLNHEFSLNWGCSWTFWAAKLIWKLINMEPQHVESVMLWGLVMLNRYQVTMPMDHWGWDGC